MTLAFHRKSFLTNTALFLVLGLPSVGLAQSNSSQPSGGASLSQNPQDQAEIDFWNVEQKIKAGKINFWDSSVTDEQRTRLLDNEDLMHDVIFANDKSDENSSALSNDNAEYVYDFIIHNKIIDAPAYMLMHTWLTADLIRHGQAEKIWNTFKNAPPEIQNQFFKNKNILWPLLANGQRNNVWNYFHGEQFSDPIEAINERHNGPHSRTCE